MNIHDQLATSYSQQLAMTEIENMEDYDTVKLLVGNAEDIVSRAKERLEELLPKPTTQVGEPVPAKSAPWGEDFTVIRDGLIYQATWFRHQHEHLDKPCSTCRMMVDGDAPRLRVRSGPKGFVTAKSKGVKNEYDCEECAWTFYAAVLPL